MSSSPRLADARMCVWSEDGSRLAVATGDGVALWQLGSGLSLQTPGPADPVDVLAFDGATLWSAGADELRRLELATGAVIERRATTGTVLALSPAGRVWVAHAGSTLTIGALDSDAARSQVRPDLRTPDEDDDDWTWDFEQRHAVRSVAVAPDGARMVAAYVDGACWMFDLRGDRHHPLRVAGEPMVTAIAWSPAGDAVVLAGAGQFVVHGGPAWQPRRHDERATALFEDVTAVAFSPGAGELAITSEYQAEDGTVEDLEFIRIDAIAARARRTHIQIRDMPTVRHIPSARAAAYHPGGRVLAICTDHRGVSLWDSEAHSYLGSLQVFAGRAAGLLAHEPRTVGEDGRIELVGDPAQLAGLGADVYSPWTAVCRVSSGHGALAEALARRLQASDRRRRGALKR